MHFHTISRAALAVALVSAASPAFADEAAADADSIIVTGTSVEETLPQDVARYGADLHQVTEREIDDRGAVDVAAALQMVPGLYVMPRSGPFSYVDVSLQGSRTQDVLWTVDGIRINNRLYGGTSPNDTLPASMVERIEVLKGGEGLFYGTQAAAGVINVVTRSFSDEFGGQVNAQVDSRAATNLDGWVRGSAGRHRFVAWASHNRAEGYRPYTDIEPSATDRKYGYDLWSVGGKYQYDFGGDLMLNAQYIHTEAKIDNLSPIRVRESRNDRNEEIASLRLDYTGSDTVQFFLKGYYHDWSTAYVSIRNALDGGPPIVLYPAGTFWGYKDFGGSAMAKLRLHRGLEYLVGYDFQNFDGRDDVLLIGRTREQVHAGVLQVRTTDDLSERARFSAGLRHNEAKGANATVWNVSGRVEVSEAFYVEANGGTSFLLPSASQLYQIDPCCERGNPNLDAEESLSGNVSVGGRLADGRLTWQLTAFARRIDNLIDISYTEPGFPDGLYVNVDDRVNVRGAEVQLGLHPSPAWDIAASYTWTRSRDSGSDIQRDRTPEQLARGSVAWRPENLPVSANVQVSWVGDTWRTISGFGRRNYGDYVLVDAGLQIFPDAERRHRLGVNIENLFDKAYVSGLASAARDNGSGRFLYGNRGVPRTLRMSYGVSF